MKEILLYGKNGTGKVAIVDDEHYEKLSVYRWNVNSDGYACTHVKQSDGTFKGKKMHRMVLCLKDGEEVDHKDLNPLNNTKENLRICTRSQNCSNRRVFKNNKSGVKGVYFRDRRGKPRWIAEIRVYKKKKYLGDFVTIEEATKAYNVAAKDFFGEFARLNTV